MYGFILLFIFEFLFLLTVKRYFMLCLVNENKVGEG
jgi:hypothetical protein